MRSTVLWLLGLAMVAVAPSQSHAADLTTLVSFCAGGIPCADGAEPSAGLIADAKGHLFGATVIGGANDHGTVFEIINTASGYVSTPTTLVSFCLLANCADGNGPSGLIADAKGNLFGTTILGGAFSTTTFGGAGGTVFEITDSGFVVSRKFDGTPGSPSCFGQSVSALAQQYGGFMGAADALDYPSVPALQDAILEFCEPEAADHANQRHH